MGLVRNEQLLTPKNKQRYSDLQLKKSGEEVKFTVCSKPVGYHIKSKSKESR
jgi:hypothetical protein